MSKWTNATLTADGQNLQAQLLDGGGFEFTKVTAADSSGTDKLTLTMQPSVIAGKTITVPVLLSNSNLSAGFTMNQLKFYARKTGIPAGDEIVYAIAEDETGDEIPSESDSPGFTIDWSYTFQFGNATSVNVSIDPAGLVSMALLGSPGGIATLNNAGAVPIEQGGTGAVTASAALAALGGMRASATGDDIPTSASDPTSISSQLSNLESSKLNKTLRTGSGQDLNAIIPSSGSIEVYRVFNPSANVPPGYTENSCDFFLIAICEAAQLYVRQYAFDVRSTAIWTRRAYDDSGVIHWQDWKQIVLATPPQEFDLPLASGWSNYSGMWSRYWKNQFDEVSVVVDISNPNTVSHGAVVATLPEGFRPAAAFDAPTIIYDGSEILPVRAYFSTNGQISISGYSNQTWSKVLFFETQASFIAVS